MRILVTNDDGYNAAGLKLLVKSALKFGEVTVVAPQTQCSAMSHRLTIYDELVVKKQDIGIEGVTTFSVSGTPADCVRVAMTKICDARPDIVFSGINNGYNAGYDIVYSGTVGAAMEALMYAHIPAIAYSVERDDRLETVEEYIDGITKDLLEREIARNEIWNVNFPGLARGECKGILYDRVPEQAEFHQDFYVMRMLSGGDIGMKLDGEAKCRTTPGTDYDAVLNGYISIGKVRHQVMN
ncbi:MAG: 5'/3'-nucleotidase SurE [Lachnospiraceae bacterium]|nr:5'/3'-nucleotidase SurE [Lachnospiraceae bacterium]